ncbi:hypothetical protein [Glaciihabitans sp. UYNi722]|uniref:hypothetical protein n=1 Tax=Glaciihabitans sp. UYNi722 TaxID=3156344 RepID=UPI0033977E65
MRRLRAEHSRLHAIAAGDVAVFDALYDAFSLPTYSLCRLLSERPENATALMNAVWMHIWQNAAALAVETGSIQTIVLRVVARLTAL